MGMETQTLRWFQQVADGVTVTEVSELENTTQPGVSRALARLEAEVGTPLLRHVPGHGRGRGPRTGWLVTSTPVWAAPRRAWSAGRCPR